MVFIGGSGKRAVYYFNKFIYIWNVNLYAHKKDLTSKKNFVKACLGNPILGIAFSIDDLSMISQGISNTDVGT